MRRNVMREGYEYIPVIAGDCDAFIRNTPVSNAICEAALELGVAKWRRFAGTECVEVTDKMLEKSDEIAAAAYDKIGDRYQEEECQALFNSFEDLIDESKVDPDKRVESLLDQLVQAALLVADGNARAKMIADVRAMENKVLGRGLLWQGSDRRAQILASAERRSKRTR